MQRANHTDYSKEEKQTIRDLNSGWNKLGLIKNLTTEDMQLLCDIDLGTHEKKAKDEIELQVIKGAKKQQTEFAGILAKKFEGCEDTSRDEGLIKKYKKLADPGFKDESPDSILKTSNLYRAHSIYSEIRLFASRALKFFVNMREEHAKYIDSLGFFGKSVLPRLLAIAGLSYGARLLVDIVTVAYTTLRPARSEGEKNMSRWQRFLNVLQKGDRLHRMANDAIWFAINLSTFLIGGGIVSAAISMGGMLFDVVHEIQKGYADYKKYSKLANKISLEMEEVNKERDKAIHEKRPHDEIKALNAKYNELKLLKEKVKEKSHSRIWERAKPIVAATLLFVGLGLILFPPTFIPGAVLLGSGISLVCGSLLTGLGKRIGGWIVDKVSSCFKKPENGNAHDNHEPSNSPSPSPNQQTAMIIGAVNGTPIGTPTDAKSPTLPIETTAKPAAPTPHNDRISKSYPSFIDYPPIAPFNKVSAKSNLVPNSIFTQPTSSVEIEKTPLLPKPSSSIGLRQSREDNQ